MSALQLDGARNARTDKVTSRAVGEGLRRTRESHGWSRGQLVDRLPSGIGERTLLSYEHGTRQLTLLRFIEICGALQTDPPSLLRQALQRARIDLANLTLQIDLRALLNDESIAFRPMRQWARNARNRASGEIVEITPDVVENLALFVGCTFGELAGHLARFVPDEVAAKR